MNKMDCFMDEKEKIDGGSKDNVTFHGMKTPDTLELTEYFDTSDVTDMSSMFQDIRVPTPEEIGVPPKGILRETQDGLMHYEGELGVFDYNPEEFEINRYFTSYLHYCGTGNSVNLPKGCKNTRYMFYECELPAGFHLGEDFDTSEVTDMSFMFYGCKFPEGFTLGRYFNTINVKFMTSMFDTCEFPEGFTLGNNFNTIKVTDMGSMFRRCKFPEGFTLGRYFNTINVRFMSRMFSACRFHENFSLGEKFDTSNVIDMENMFTSCVFPKGFRFGEHFKTNNVKTMDYIFCSAEFLDGFILDDNFSINSNETAIMLFEDATYRGEPVIGAQGSQEIEEILNKLKGRNS